MVDSKRGRDAGTPVLLRLPDDRVADGKTWSICTGNALNLIPLMDNMVYHDTYFHLAGFSIRNIKQVWINLAGARARARAHPPALLLHTISCFLKLIN